MTLDFHTQSDFPEELYHIEPGCAFVFVPEDEDLISVRKAEELNYHFQKSSHGMEFGFDIKLDIKATNDPRLVNKIVARRINFGSMQKYSVIAADFTDYNALDAFSQEYFDILSQGTEQVRIIGLDHNLDGEFYRGRMSYVPLDRSNPEDAQIAELEDEKQRICNDLAHLISDYAARFHQMPPMEEIRNRVQGRVLLGYNGQSKLRVDRDLKVILPAYNDIEIPLRPLQKALYFLFLRHPEGIRLSDIGNYRDELEDLYSLVIPNRDYELMQTSLDLLTDPMNTESLRQQLSKIKRTVCARIISDDMAKNYYISGDRGKAYKIPLDRRKVEMPPALTIY